MTCLNYPRSLYRKCYLLILTISILITGCGLRDENQLYSRSAAEEKFIKICKEEFNWDVSTKLVGNTLWIYLPFEKDIFQLKANRFGQTNRCLIGYLESDFTEKVFYFEYQIMPLLKTEEAKGYTYSLTESMGEDFQNLLNVIYRVYFNAQEEPEFYVLVMADIINGVEIIYTIYGLDLKKIYNHAIPGEEYYKRIPQDIKGDLAIIHDRSGRHLSYREIEMGEFLAKQIAQRIRIKFIGTEDICDAPEEEILKIIAYCLRAYQFKDYRKVIMINLLTGIQMTKTRLDMKEIKEF